MFDAIFADIERLRLKGWDVMIDTDPEAGWDVELAAGEECLCEETETCPHNGALVRQTGRKLEEVLRIAVDRALCIKPMWLESTEKV